MQRTPLPNPPPQAGEGAHRIRFCPLPFTGEGAALIGARRVGAFTFHRLNDGRRPFAQ